MSLPHLRQQIDQLDREIIERIAKRLALAQQTTSLKSSVYDAKREEELKTLWRTEAQKHSLNPEPCLAILQILIDEAARLQNS